MCCERASDQTSRDMHRPTIVRVATPITCVTHLAMAGTTAESTRRSESYRDKFKNVFPDLVKELAKDESNPEIADSIEHLKKVMSTTRVKVNLITPLISCPSAGSELQCAWRCVVIQELAACNVL